jgi:dihydrodipicolinate synthase/N-acetylneuraminate lyase
MAAHFKHLSPYVGGFLMPGSTGDGWELSRTERKEVLAIGLEQAQRLNVQLLIGALHPDATQALTLIQEDMDWLKCRFVEHDPPKVLVQARVCGFTVCPPRGQKLSQEDIGRSLASILELGLPTAIYQLPQVTLNEISPELAADLARCYPNFIFFKDTSGTDAVTLSGKGLGGVFAARGAEGDYARWFRAAGGVYDGFLLASSNSFARELHRVIADISAGRLEQASRLSQRLTLAVSEVLQLATGLPDGNPFANGNKALDHFFAYGPKAVAMPPPRLHAGSSLPVTLIRSTEEILCREQLMPASGYLE